MAAPRLTVVLTWWVGWRPLYAIENVRAMSRQLRQYVRIPFRIVLLTDQPTTRESAEVDAVLPLPPEPKQMSVRHGINCFRRLRYFDPGFSAQFGTEWILSIDLDTLILEDVTDIVETMMNDFGFSILRAYEYRPGHGQRCYNGGMFALRVGEHSHVWSAFDWMDSPIECAKTGWRGSDQTWLSLRLPGAPVIGQEHGVYFVSAFKKSSDDDPQPRMIHYGGPNKPWSKVSKQDTPELWAEYQRFL